MMFFYIVNKRAFLLATYTAPLWLVSDPSMLQYDALLADYCTDTLQQSPR